MEFRLLAFAFVSVAFVASQADQVPPEVYWYSMLPHTPMPKFIQQLLPALEIDNLGGVSPHQLGDIKGQLSSFLFYHNHNHDAASKLGDQLGDIKGQLSSFLFYHNHNHNQDATSNLGDQLGDIKGQLSSFLFYHNHESASNLNGGDDSKGQLGDIKGRLSLFYIKPNHGAASKLNSGDQLENKNGQLSSLLFYHPASEEQLPEKFQNMTLFLLEKDLHPGVKMNFPFDDHHRVHGDGGAKVLTRQAAQSIPFSSHKFSEILNLFSIKPESKEAFIMKKTIEACEEPAKEGEDKYCATSLEGMVDFVASKLGKDVRAMASIKEADDDHDRFLTISAVNKMTGDDNKPIVSCHGLNYVYPVFYCHGFQEGTRVYEVPLAGAEGMVKAKANVVCHTNTSTWDPNHLSFQQLRVMPGTVPICHFLPQNNVLWATSA